MNVCAELGWAMCPWWSQKAAKFGRRGALTTSQLPHFRPRSRGARKFPKVQQWRNIRKFPGGRPLDSSSSGWRIVPTGAPARASAHQPQAAGSAPPLHSRANFRRKNGNSHGRPGPAHCRRPRPVDRKHQMRLRRCQPTQQLLLHVSLSDRAEFITRGSDGGPRI